MKLEDRMARNFATLGPLPASRYIIPIERELQFLVIVR